MRIGVVCQVMKVLKRFPAPQIFPFNWPVLQVTCLGSQHLGKAKLSY